jgi:hypothetical protein
MQFRIPGFLNITPVTSYITSTYPEEICCLPRVGAFPLEGVKIFHKGKQIAVIGRISHKSADVIDLFEITRPWKTIERAGVKRLKAC